MDYLILKNLQKDLQISKKKAANIKALLTIPCSTNAKKVLLKEFEETIRKITLIEILLQENKN
jgi:hypothetical protein